MDIKVVKEIDDFHKIVRFSANRKDSDYQRDEASVNTHMMLVSYQVIQRGKEDEKASISLFEYDEER
jgi:hypothetical protein